MFESREQAESILRMYFAMSGEIDRSVAQIMRSAPDPEFQAYRRAAGAVMGEIFFSVLSPIFEAHPDLVPPEMDGAPPGSTSPNSAGEDGEGA